MSPSIKGNKETNIFLVVSIFSPPHFHFNAIRDFIYIIIYVSGASSSQDIIFDLRIEKFFDYEVLLYNEIILLAFFWIAR